MRRTGRHLTLLAGILLTAAAAHAQKVLVHDDNMAELKCDPPDATCRFLGSTAPGQLFFPGETVTVRLSIKKAENETTLDGTIEIQEIGTRTPGKVVKGMEGFSDTAGHAPIVDVIGPPVAHPIKVDFGEAADKEIEVQKLPLPARLGTYALVLCRKDPGGGADQRLFIGTLARVPRPRPYGTADNTPVFGEGQFMGGDIKIKAAIYGRMGIRGWRSELSWTEDMSEAERQSGKVDLNAVGPTNWDPYDKLFAAAKEAGCQIMVTLGGHGGWKWPFRIHQTPGAVGNMPDWNFNPYGGRCDWLCGPELYPRYEKWITEFARRYWEDGKGGLWGLENFNEPWEGGGISGWARDCIQYREIQRVIARAARSVSPDIRLLAASSIMNTEDKLFSDGSKEFEQYVDIFTDHYVPPCMCYGPMVAASRGKESMESETWFVGREYELPQGVAQFMAAGQRRISPWHPRALFDNIPGGNDNTLMPAPVVAATAAFNYFVTGKPFEKLVFKTHLPWVFQFGKDDDKDALLVVFGQLIQIGGNNPKESLWSQVDSVPGGEMQIDNADGLLRFYDLAGNPLYEGEKTVRLPMSIFPSYVMCEKGPAAAAARLTQARITGKRPPVEILPRDFTTLLTAKNAALNVELHNCLNRAISGTLTVTAPANISLATAALPVELAAGETKEVTFPVAKATPQEANVYGFSFSFSSDAGNAAYAENLNTTVAPKVRIKVDGNLSEWKTIPGVALIGSEEKVDSTELLRRPWLAIKEQHPNITSGWLKMAWDDGHLYICAQVNDPTEEKTPIRFGDRDEDAYFHTKADDDRDPFKSFLEKTKNREGKSLKDMGRSFAEVPYVYAFPPEAGIPFRRDRVQVAFDVTDGWHDLTATTNTVPYGFHTVPDTDYEFSLYLCEDGKGELWRQLAPGVPRIHDFPRQPRGKTTTGVQKGARHVVKRDGSTYTYELAIPKAALADLALTPGTTFGFAWKIGNSQGANVESGHDKAVCKQNGLTLHPYWERSPSAAVRWALVE